MKKNYKYGFMSKNSEESKKMARITYKNIQWKYSLIIQRLMCLKAWKANTDFCGKFISRTLCQSKAEQLEGERYCGVKMRGSNSASCPGKSKRGREKGRNWLNISFGCSVFHISPRLFSTPTPPPRKLLESWREVTNRRKQAGWWKNKANIIINQTVSRRQVHVLITGVQGKAMSRNEQSKPVFLSTPCTPAPSSSSNSALSELDTADFDSLLPLWLQLLPPAPAWLSQVVVNQLCLSAWRYPSKPEFQQSEI